MSQIVGGIATATRHLQKIVPTRLLLLRTNFLTWLQKLRVFQIVGGVAMATGVCNQPPNMAQNHTTLLQSGVEFAGPILFLPP